MSHERASERPIELFAPARVTLTAELSQATTLSPRPSFWMRACAASALRPTAAMSPPVAPPSGAIRPRWYATRIVCAARVLCQTSDILHGMHDEPRSRSRTR